MLADNGFVRRHSVLIYFFLAILLTWGSMALAAYPGGFPLTEAQLETAGPIIYTAMLIGPTGAALLLTGLLDGRQGFRKLFGRLLVWRVSLRWYAAALLTAPVLITALLFGLTLFSAEYRPVLFTPAGSLTLLLSAVAAGLAVGLFEELGWTGFALPRMKGSYSAVGTGLIIGLVWGLWHFPPFWENDTFSAALPLALLLGRLFAWLPPYRILMVHVYERTHSLLLAVLMHASLMASLTALVPADITGMTLLTWIIVWALALWGIVAVVSLLQGRPVADQVELRGHGSPTIAS
ncbi:MAG: CPBP family intramembrane metalloprotease [Anaerolineales bacterium]|nr:CPBP family intramembrane metalloprotease [Anaerolineales bacterium]